MVVFVPAHHDLQSQPFYPRNKKKRKNAELFLGLLLLLSFDDLNDFVAFAIIQIQVLRKFDHFFQCLVLMPGGHHEEIPLLTVPSIDPIHDVMPQLTVFPVAQNSSILASIRSYRS